WRRRMHSKKSMVFVLMLFAAPVGAHASPLLVLEQEKASETSLISAKFEVNRELGRAWLEIQITDSGLIGEDLLVEVIRKPVEGLSYDQSTSQVVYSREGHSVVCANEKESLFHKYYAPTAECSIAISFEDRTFDDGFNQASRVVSKVVFDPQA